MTVENVSNSAAIQASGKRFARAGKIIGVYCITCKANGKAYVGWSKTVHTRLAWHKSHLKNGKHPRLHLQQDFNQHGAAGFSFEIVAMHSSEDDARVEEAVRISEAFKAGKAYNAVVPVDVSEVFKQRAVNITRRVEAERIQREAENQRQRNERVLKEKRSLIWEWMTSCITYTRCALDDRKFVEMIDEFLLVAALSAEEFGLATVGDADFVAKLHAVGAPSSTLADVKKVREYIEAYIAGIECDQKDYGPILASAEKVVVMTCEKFRNWIRAAEAA